MCLQGLVAHAQCHLVERDLSNRSIVEVLEEQMNGFYRVFSVLKYPIKLNEKYVCTQQRQMWTTSPSESAASTQVSEFKQDVFHHKEAIIQLYPPNAKCISHFWALWRFKETQGQKPIAFGKGGWWGGISLGLKKGHTSGTDSFHPDQCGCYYWWGFSPSGKDVSFMMWQSE